MVAEISQNGWPASPDPAAIGIAPFSPVDGVSFGGGVRSGPVAAVLGYVAREFDRRVERLLSGWCWGYNYRPVIGGTVLSNHASGTAIDVNAPHHPLGAVGTFSQAQVDEIHQILNETGGVVRWGGDYTGRRDEMHLEIVGTLAQVLSAAITLEVGKMRLMYDSVTATDIPRTASMVAGYVSGPYAWSASDWARFKGVPQVRIATQASHNVGNCLDVERGDATPEQAPGWVKKRRAAGEDPTVYCNELNGWPAVRRAFHDQKIAEPHYWVARYDGVAQIPSGAVAKQYRNATTSGGHYDLSIVADFWPGVDLTRPPQGKDENMAYPYPIPPYPGESDEDYNELVIALPPQNGDTAVSRVWVSIAAANSELRLRIAHWQCGTPDNHRAVPALPGDTTIDELGTSGGLQAPSDAYSLVLDYQSELGASVVVEPV